MSSDVSDFSDLIAFLKDCIEVDTWGATEPAIVLREAAAKREMVAAVERFLNPHPGQPCTNEGDPFDSCELHVARMETAVTPYALRLLASIYADRPGFRQEWAP